MKGKTLEPTTIEDKPLPGTVTYYEITDAPKTLAELDQAAQAQLSAASATIGTLGDLAFEDLVTELFVANEAITNAKIAVDAIQGDVIAANAITNTKIADDAISTPKLQAASITGGKIAAGTITASNIQAGTITGDRIAANTITTNKLQAGEIIGFTITGSLIRTSSTGTRVQMNNSTNALEIYSGSVKRAQMYDTGLTFWDSSGNNVADIYAGSTGSLLITTVNSGASARSIYIQAGSGGVASLGIEGVSYLYAEGTSQTIRLSKSIDPTTGGLHIGGSSIYLASIATFEMKLDTIGHILYDGSYLQLPTDWTVTRVSAGKYDIDHPYAVGSYSVVVTAVNPAGSAITAKLESVDSYTFRVVTINDVGVAVDSDFTFICVQA